MKRILEQVASHRIMNFDESKVIQLSSVFMKATIDSLNKEVGTNLFVFDENYTQIKLVMFDHEFTIVHRAYRDDTNDRDVEEAILHYFNSKMMLEYIQSFPPNANSNTESVDFSDFFDNDTALS